MTDTAKKCPVCYGRGALHCDCWPGDCICGWDDEPCEECAGMGWLDDSYDDDFEMMAIAAAVVLASPQTIQDRTRQSPAIKPDKRAKVKAARAQNVKRKGK